MKSKRVVQRVAWALGVAATLATAALFFSIGGGAWIFGLIAIVPLVAMAVLTAPGVSLTRRAARIGWWIAFVLWFLLIGNLAIANAEFELRQIATSVAALLLLAIAASLREHREEGTGEAA